MNRNQGIAWLCGHPVTPENTAPNEHYGQCRRCKLDYQTRWNRRRREALRSAAAPVSPAQSLYRAEKARRSA